MTASFIDRVCANGDYAEDGGPIDVLDATALIWAWHGGMSTLAQIVTAYELTGEQETELEEIFDTRPELLEVPLLGAVFASGEYAQWPGKVCAALHHGVVKKSGFGYTTSAEVRSKLGL
jgi:hypothetical protein